MEHPYTTILLNKLEASPERLKITTTLSEMIGNYCKIWQVRLLWFFLQQEWVLNSKILLIRSQ